MKIQASLKVLPSLNTQKEVYDKVNEVIEILVDANLKAKVGPSETTIEGDYKEVFNLIEKIHSKLVEDEIRQITMMIVTDYNKQENYIDEKLENVNKYLNI